MNEYHKIQTVFKRDPNNHYKTLLPGEYSLPAFDYLKSCKWVFTEKIDGTNIRVIWKGGVLSFGGKTDRAQIPQFLLDALESTFTQDKMADKFGDTEACLYGEGYGPKIQGGGKYKDTNDFILFDVRIGEWWLERDNIEDVAYNLSVDVVPVIGQGSLGDMVETVKEGFNSLWGEFQAEGIVARPAVELKARSGERIITKLKHKDFA